MNLKEREELVRDLLAQLPTKYQGTHDTNSALGAGLQAAYKLIVFIFHSENCPVYEIR